MSEVASGLPKFENEAEALRWFWDNSRIPRDLARNILAAVGTEMNPLFGSVNLSPEEIIELLLLTVAVTLTLSLPGPDRRRQKLIDQYRNYLKAAQPLADAGAPIPAPSARAMEKFLAQGPKNEGAPPKKLRGKIFARLVGFLEFCSGRETWASGNDPRVIGLKDQSIFLLALAFRKDKNPWVVKLGEQLVMPGDIGTMLGAAKKNTADLAFAGKVFWTLALLVFPTKIKATLKCKNSGQTPPT